MKNGRCGPNTELWPLIEIKETELIQHNFQGMIIMTDLIRREIGVDNGRLVEPLTVWVSRYYLFGSGSIHLLYKAVLWIRDIFVRIRIRGSMPLTNGSGFRSLLFLSLIFKTPTKKIVITDPDPGGPNTYGPYRSGSPTLLESVELTEIYPGKFIFQSSKQVNFKSNWLSLTLSWKINVSTR